MRLEDMGHQEVHQGPQLHEAVLQGSSCQEQASLAAKRQRELEGGWSRSSQPSGHPTLQTKSTLTQIPISISTCWSLAVTASAVTWSSWCSEPHPEWDSASSCGGRLGGPAAPACKMWYTHGRHWAWSSPEYQEKAKDVGVKRQDRTKGKHIIILMGQKSGWKKRKSQEQHRMTEGGKEIHLRKGPKIRGGID